MSPVVVGYGSSTTRGGGGLDLEPPPPILVDTAQNKYRQLNNMNSSGSSTTLIIPKPPTPLYPDVPWWAVLVTALVFSIVGVLAGVLSAKAGPGAAVPGVSGFSGPSILIDTMSYIPHILLLFGVLADMFTLDGVWSIPSLVGVLSIFANYVFQYFWKGIDELVNTGKGIAARATSEAPAAPAVGGSLLPTTSSLFNGYTGCTVQGFGSFATPFAPQTLVVTSTVFAYYCYDLIRNRGWTNSIGAILSFIIAYIGEAGVIMIQNDNGCDGGTNGAGAVRALFEGLLFGGLGYGIVQTYAPNRLPSSTISPFPRKSSSDLSAGPDGKMYDKDGYPYVILPNGQAFPDVSDAKSRAAFGQLAGSATGTTVSLASNCAATKATCSG